MGFALSHTAPGKHACVCACVCVPILQQEAAVVPASFPEYSKNSPRLVKLIFGACDMVLSVSEHTDLDFYIL